MESSGQYQAPTRPLVVLTNCLKGKRPLARRRDVGNVREPVGAVSITFVRGSFGCSRPYFVLELDGNEQRLDGIKTSIPVWGEGALPDATFTLPVFDPSSDLRIFLFDDAATRNEVAI